MLNDLFEGFRFFQDAVFEKLAAGSSVIVQAPTGAGKTRAALTPFLFNLAELAVGAPEKFPRKCIYCVPMRALANQFFADYSGQIMAQYVRRERIKPEPDIAIQTGEHPTDSHFEGTLIFATIDQVLSSFLNIPYGTGDKFANLNAGAIVGSFLVFDEFHLFDPDTTLPTTLAMLKLLKGITPFVLMTATFSRAMLEKLAGELDAEIVPPLDADGHKYFSDIPAQRADRQRVFEWLDEPLTADHVLAKHKKRSICICNLVDRSIQLYEDLVKHPDSKGIEITLLHSRFLQSDRARKETAIREIFGAADYDYDGPPQILVATQVIEVGLDITCDVMHTELAPAASLLQRAGRCARRAEERDGVLYAEQGKVFIYDPPDDVLPEPSPDESEESQARKPPRLKYAPYYLPDGKAPTERGRILMKNTRDALESGAFTGHHMDFDLEQRFINAVHTEVDEEVIDQLKAGYATRLDEMFTTIANLERGRASSLIRKSEDTRYILIHPEPNRDEELLKYPWTYQGFSLRPSLIAQAWKQVEEDGLLNPDIIPWVAMEACAPATDALMDENEGQSLPRYIWEPLKTPNDVYQASIALALHPHFAEYTHERGLVLGQIAERATPPLTKPEQQNRSRYDGYHLESYVEHIAGLNAAYTHEHPTQVWRAGKREVIFRPALRDEMAYALKRIEQSPRFGLRPGLLDEVIRAILALHDIGKLSVNWQAFAHEWQRMEGKGIAAEFMAAHTDYDGSDEAQRERNRELKRKLKPGNHAGEGAVAAIPLLMSVCQQAEGGERLFRAALTAIARHHTPTVTDYAPFCFDDAAQNAIAEALEVVGLAELIPELKDGILWEVTHDTGSLQANMVFPERHSQQDTILYMLLARVLRLADGRSFGV